VVKEKENIGSGMLRQESGLALASRRRVGILAIKDLIQLFDGRRPGKAFKRTFRHLLRRAYESSPRNAS
jgi:hypothetical protein